MSKVMINLNVNELSNAIEQLSQSEKTRLIKKLEKETWSSRFNQLLRRVRQRAKQSPLSEQKISSEIESVRQRRYDQGGY